MILLRVFLITLAWCVISGEHMINLVQTPRIQIALETNPKGGLKLIVNKDRISKVIAVIGRRVEVVDVNYVPEIILTFSHNTTLKISELPVEKDIGVVLNLEWDAPKTVRLEDCLNLDSTHWYGGPQQKRQYWPIENLVLENYAYITKDADNCAIAERYWINSAGNFFYIDKRTPLFVDQNSIEKNAACFIAEIKPPYSSRRTGNNLRYAVGVFDNPRKAHEFAVRHFLGKPSGIPDTNLITYPVWSTWGSFKSNINEKTLIDFAKTIKKYELQHSYFEIDDGWEACYGSWNVDTAKFPHLATTIKELKEMGFGVIMWVHPFLNTNCPAPPVDSIELETSSTLKNESYFVTSELHANYLTSWWNDNGTTTSLIDVTKPDARSWYLSTLDFFKKTYDIDGFKFDAGESSWAPQISVLNCDVEEQPNCFSTEYAKAAATFGDKVEVRTGFGTQNLPIFVRMTDKDTYFTFDNGLPTLVTTLLQMNMNGYPLVMPDMIGGDGYSSPPSRELYIRWLQASTFMPTMRFSYAPWNDKELWSIVRTFTNLHEKYAPEIIAACKRAVRDGSPVNPPIWWIAPEDTTAHGIWDEFLLGEKILVAPMLEHDSDERDIYLPVGTWLEQGDPERIIEGPTWLRRYSAAIDYLPYFVKLTGDLN